MVTGDYYYDDTVQLRVKRLCMVAVGEKKEGEGGERGGRREKNSKEREGGKGEEYVYSGTGTLWGQRFCPL